MKCSSLKTYVALASIFHSALSRPVDSVNATVKIIKRNAALDAALSAQSATTFMVCTLSYQTKYAAFALGIGTNPAVCVAPAPASATSISSPTIATTSTTSAYIPVDTSQAFVPCSPTNPSSCMVQQQALAAHNNARATHHVQPLVWNDTLAQAALTWVSKGIWGHSQELNQPLFPYPYGENLFATTLNYPSSTMTQAMYAFTSEEALYDYSKPGFSEATGHFTQVVWASTTQVGCAVLNLDLDIFASKTSSSAYFACEYYPSGNWLNQFPQNVFAP